MNKTKSAIFHPLLVGLFLAVCSTGLLADNSDVFANPAAEATIYEEDDGGNGGGTSDVCVGNKGPVTNTRHAYVRYDLPVIPEGAVFTRVVLSLLQVQVREDAPSTATLELRRVTSAWEEGTGIGPSIGGGPCSGGTTS